MNHGFDAMLLERLSQRMTVKQVALDKLRIGSDRLAMTFVQAIVDDDFVAISRELNLPIRFVGTGEQIDDLVPFDAQTYVNSLFD